MNNPDFNLVEFHQIKTEVGLNRVVMSVKKWIELTNAKGITSTTGRYGGTFAHKDIAFEFGTWISPEFKLYLIKEFQLLKEEEMRRSSLEWNLNRALSKLNYRIHTDAVKEHIVPIGVSPEQAGYVYASQADLLNVALFGCTAKQWREANPTADGNIRDNASIEQLLVLVNLESLNAEFIREGMSDQDRVVRLNQTAVTQLTSLVSMRTTAKKLSKPKE
jgi:KilA-N domain